MYKIGLTGSIGAGKSTVARYLEKGGYPVVDADRLGHEAYLPNTLGFRCVVDAFGQNIVGKDGTIDRKLLANLVFSDPTKLQRLNGIVWPDIKRLAVARFVQIRHKRQHPIVFLEAAVLLEANWDTIVDEVWTILAESMSVVHRVVARDEATETQLKQRMDAQISNEERLRRSNVIIYNNSTIPDLHSSVDQELSNLHQRIQGDI